MTNVNHMLVYGTLRRGQRANSMMEAGGTYVQSVRLPDARMFSLGGFPGIRLGGGGGIECELYRIDDPKLIERADFYEGYYGEGSEHNLYDRRVVSTPDGVQAYIYEFHEDRPGDIPTGDWCNR